MTVGRCRGLFAETLREHLSGVLCRRCESDPAGRVGGLAPVVVFCATPPHVSSAIRRISETSTPCALMPPEVTRRIVYTWDGIGTDRVR